MKICIIGGDSFKENIIRHIDNRFIKFYSYPSIMSALQDYSLGQVWQIAFIEKSFEEDAKFLSAECLLKKSLPNIIILPISKDKDKVIPSIEIEALCKKQGPLRFNDSKRTVYQDGKSIILRRKEWQLLKFFNKYKGKVISQESILEAVWGYKYKHKSRTLNTHIVQIRKKLGNDIVQIKNLPKQGYVMLEVS